MRDYLSSLSKKNNTATQGTELTKPTQTPSVSSVSSVSAFSKKPEGFDYTPVSFVSYGFKTR